MQYIDISTYRFITSSAATVCQYVDMSGHGWFCMSLQPSHIDMC